jgi:hypothetical protein
MKRMSGRLLTLSEYFSNLVFSARRRSTSGDGGLDTPNKPETTASRASDAVIVQDTHIRGEAAVVVGELN